MELDRYCNDCLSYYSYNEDENPQKCRLWVRQIQKMSSKEIKIYYFFLFFIYIALCYNKKKNRKIDKI